MAIRQRMIQAMTLVIGCAGLSIAKAGTPVLSTYPTKYYTIHTDLSESDVREAALRVNRMADEYALRTRDFSGKITERLPFYIFSNAEDYYDAGGFPRSAGVYTGDKLMAISGAQYESRWRIVQHEAFHQFAHRVIGGRLPVWVNEGMAVYFEEAIFTGDNIVTGLVPRWRLRNIRAVIKDGRHKPLLDMMSMAHLQWNHEFTSTNYLQAWSMVHFLVHGHNGTLVPRFEAFIRDVNIKALTWEKSWQKNFGTDIQAFEDAWKKYWLELPDDAGEAKRMEATISTLTSFLGRAASQGTFHADFESFLAAAQHFEKGKTKAWPAHKDDWLPNSLMSWALKQLDGADAWKLVGRGRNARIQCTVPGHVRLTGQFTLRGRQIQGVSIRSTPSAKRNKGGRNRR
ncbi:MAG: DUF1570 domain-containing protein [Phycisphaerae bacterium]